MKHNLEKVSEYETHTGNIVEVFVCEQGLFSFHDDNRFLQRDLEPKVAMRYMSHCLQNSEYLVAKTHSYNNEIV